MSFEYERASRQKPVLGTAAGVAMDGAHYTAVIDSNTHGCKAITFVANISALVAYEDTSWTIKESDDDSTYTDVDSTQVVYPMPADGSVTSKVFHAGSVSKKRYVKAAFTSGGSETGQITALLEHPLSAPIFPTS